MELKFQEIADPKSIQRLDALGRGLAQLISIVRSFRVDFPKIYRVTGDVSINSIDSMPPVEISNLSDLEDYFKSLGAKLEGSEKATLAAIKEALSQAKSGKDLTMPESIKLEKMEELLDGFEELKKGFNFLINKETDTGLARVEVTNFPVPKIPQPVTNININPLRGFVKSTSVSVTTSITPLPGTALANRRGITLYNNGSNTIFIGGSDVTTTNGLPVPSGTFSPALDIGPRMIVYGIVATATENARVLELSNDDMGGNH